ncbi:MAG: leucyl aminopeptidase, partial [Myxococcota bacterium]
MALPKLIPTSTWDGDWDSVIVVGPGPDTSFPALIGAAWAHAAEVDRTFGRRTSLLITEAAPGGRLIHAPVGPLQQDWDDVRRFGEAAAAGIRRARDAGSTLPLLVIQNEGSRPGFERAEETALLGALGALWEPLEAREARGAAIEPVTGVGFLTPSGDRAEEIARFVSALESGRRLARDVCGTEPERMSPPRLAELCVERF